MTDTVGALRAQLQGLTVQYVNGPTTTNASAWTFLTQARAVLHWARETYGWDRLVSYIDPANARSVALGLRLGGVIDASLPGSEPGDVVIRHDLGALA